MLSIFANCRLVSCLVPSINLPDNLPMPLDPVREQQGEALALDGTSDYANRSTKIHATMMPSRVACKKVFVVDQFFAMQGSPDDLYFREYVHEGKVFADAPIIVAQRCCGSDHVIVDVGANIGLSTIAFSRVSPTGRVIAYEPSPQTFSFLAGNVADSGVKNVEVIQAALSKAPGTLTLSEDPAFMAGNRITSGGDVPGRSSVEIRATTLDDEVERLGLVRLDFLKVDVEGHEREVLEGATRTLARFRPICCVEFNSYALVYHLGEDPRKFLNYVAGLFPKLYYFDRDTYQLTEMSGREDEFMRRNSETGFVDDLIGSYNDIRTT